ncbi:MAG: potassium channel family protein [Metamycoplasmataceae bacterium]
MAKKDICVIGAGTFGEAVIQQLNKLKRNVLVIDRDEKALSLIESDYNSLYVAEAADLRALNACGITQFDTVIVGVSENIEIVAALLELGIKSIIARAKTKRHARVLRQIGVDVIISPEAESGTRTALIATNPNFIKYSSSLNEIGDGFVIGSSILTNNDLINKPLKTLALNKMGITIIIIKRKKEEAILPDADLKLLKDDLITVVGKVNKVTQFFGFMNSNAEETETNTQEIKKKKHIFNKLK